MSRDMPTRTASTRTPPSETPGGTGTGWCKAFNQDLPFDRFVRMQVAGDLLPEPADRDEAIENLVATGFLSLGPKVLAEPDKEKMLVDIVDEQVDVLGKTFLAQTVGCASCHDHKFDPIPPPTTTPWRGS